MIYRVFTVSSGASVEQGSISGNGSPRLFYQSALYIYGLTGALYTSVDLGFTLTNIAPAGITSVLAMCQYTNANDSTTTIFTGSGGGVYTTKYQKYPETVSGWQSGTALPAAGFIASDAIAGDFTSIPVSVPIVVGNIYRSIGARIEQSATPGPFTFVQSDTGLPSGILSAAAIITDLDAVI